MMSLILGMPRAGKTSLAYALAIAEMYNKKRLKSAKAMVESLVEGGYKALTLPKDHLVFTSTSCESNLYCKKKMTAYLCNGKRFGIPEKWCATDFYPPYSYIVFDEAQRDYDSRNFKNLEAFIKRAWETHGQMNYDLFYVSQVGNVDKLLRNLVEKVIFVLDKGQKLSDGKYSHRQSYWRYCEFNSFLEFELWFNSGRPQRASIEYVFDGDIKKCYDGEAYRAFWFNDREKSNFTLIKHKKLKNTVESFNEFLNNVGGNYDI